VLSVCWSAAVAISAAVVEVINYGVCCLHVTDVATPFTSNER